MGNFDYFKDYAPFADFAEAAVDAENVFNTSFPVCAMSCRRALEIAVKWIYDKENIPTDNVQTLASLLTNKKFQSLFESNLLKRINSLRNTGNVNTHENVRITREETLEVLRILFAFCKSIDGRYRVNPNSNIQFDPKKIPDTKMDSENLSRLNALNEQKDSVIEELTKKNKELNDSYYKQLARNMKDNIYDPAELTEFETRKFYIDMDLLSVGWEFGDENTPANVNVEFKIDDLFGNNGGPGFCDYVLFGKDGIPLAVVEAKKTTIEPNAGRTQARLYADALERKYNRRPMMFMTNGFNTIFWDDVSAPEREVSGIFSPDDLQKLANRRISYSDPTKVQIDLNITDRYYQIAAIRAVCNDINKGIRKHLVVMATGTGKTRTAASLVDVLYKAGLVTNVLFLADRNILVDQAEIDFREYLRGISTSNLCDDDHDVNASIIFSTYQTIINMIDTAEDKRGCKILTPAHFDLIIIDESHRSIFKKYRAIFDYFDSMLLGLTATPKNEVERNTYDFFDKDEGQPTYVYDYETAVNVDHYLLPYYNYEVKTKILEDGITYDSLSEDDKQRYEHDFGSEDGIPEKIESSQINNFIFNEKTIDIVIQDFMNRGIKVDGGDHVGKTIIFAANKNHANLIKKRFDTLYPQYKGIFASVIVHDNQDKFNKKIIWKFKKGHTMDPQVAISVDMMDTGVDVPDCVNLVFFKKVRSIVKFWQMIGRGTRLYPNGVFTDNIDGRYEGKRRFLIFDYCGNFEFFRQETQSYDTKSAKTISQSIFEKCIRIIYELQRSQYSSDKYQSFRQSLVDLCHGQIMALNYSLVSVHLVRQYVDKYRNEQSFQWIGESDLDELTEQIAPLVTYESIDEYSKYFDNLMFSIALAFLVGTPYSKMQKSLTEIATRLEDKISIPQIRAKLPVIQTIQSGELWIDADPLSFESVRQDLRELMQFLEKDTVKPIITDISDEVIESVEGGSAPFGFNFEDYHTKVNQYINAHRDEGPIFKIYHNLSLDSDDVAELSRIFTQELGNEEDYLETYGDEDLGIMIRTVVKLDHDSIMDAFSDFINNSSFNTQQIEFIHKIIQYLENAGVMELSALMEPPFDRPVKMMNLFNNGEMNELIGIIKGINNNAKLHPDSIMTNA